MGDLVWMHKWLTAKISLNQIEINISSAFDTINRTKLLETLHTFIDEDELKIIQFYLSNTYLHLKVNNVTKISKI